jgi:hypothetical protein
LASASCSTVRESNSWLRLGKMLAEKEVCSFGRGEVIWIERLEESEADDGAVFSNEKSSAESPPFPP